MKYINISQQTFLTCWERSKVGKCNAHLAAVSPGLDCGAVDTPFVSHDSQLTALFVDLGLDYTSDIPVYREKYKWAQSIAVFSASFFLIKKARRKFQYTCMYLCILTNVYNFYERNNLIHTKLFSHWICIIYNVQILMPN